MEMIYYVVVFFHSFPAELYHANYLFQL